jgi:hypothetical protein
VHQLRRITVAIAVAAIGLAMAASASADPSGAKNSLTLPATCGNSTVMLVVNSANGQGAGSQEQNTAPFSPAHVVGSNAVFHPTLFDLTYSETSAGGPTESFVNTDAMRNPKTPATCTIHFSETDPGGDTFAIDGTVSGFFS